MSARSPSTRSALLALAVLAFTLAGCGKSLSPTAPVRGTHAVDAPVLAAQGADEESPAGGETPARTVADNVDPVVLIVFPRPSQLFTAVVPPTFTVSWEGTDPDARSSRPLEYRYLLIDQQSSDFFTFLADPDSLRRRDAPRFDAWTPARGNRAEVELRDLVPNAQYLFVVVALDERGGYDHVFSLSKNMLRVTVTFRHALGPRLFVSGDVDYETPVGGLLDDPASAPVFQVPMAGVSTLQWASQVFPWDELDGYRWALDPTKLAVDQPGSGREGGWSGWGPEQTSATVGPFDAPGEHRFYIEVRTRLGALTRLLLRLEAVAPAEVARARGD